jgi:outer membrane lipoprotein carrier protein
MIKKIGIIKFICLFLINSAVYATPVDDLGGLLNAVQSMRANFTQTVYDNKNKAILKSYGRMSMQRPGKFRWEVQKPIPQTIIANGSRLWIYDPDLEQVTIRSLKKAAGETPALLLSHVDSILNQSYHVQALPNKTPNIQTFSLVPKEADSMFADIQMSFENKKITSMSLRDHLGHTTVVAFQKLETNISLPAALFVFKAPARIDVIDEAK